MAGGDGRQNERRGGMLFINATDPVTDFGLRRLTVYSRAPSPTAKETSNIGNGLKRFE